MEHQCIFVRVIIPGHCIVEHESLHSTIDTLHFSNPRSSISHPSPFEVIIVGKVVGYIVRLLCRSNELGPRNRSHILVAQIDAKDDEEVGIDDFDAGQ